MEIVKIGILGIAGVMVALQFRTTKPEISLYMGLAVSILIFSFSLDGLFRILQKMEVLQSYITSFLFQAAFQGRWNHLYL